MLHEEITVLKGKVQASGERLNIESCEASNPVLTHSPVPYICIYVNPIESFRPFLRFSLTFVNIMILLLHHQFSSRSWSVEMCRRTFVILCCLVTFFHSNNGFNLDQDELLKLQDVVEDLRIQFSQQNVTLSENEKILKEVIDEIPNTTGREPGIGDSPFVCAICMALSNLALYLRRVVRYDDQRAMDLSVAVCNMLRIQNEEVCRGILKYNVPPILFIIDNHRELNGDTVCKVVLEQGRCLRPPYGAAAKNLEFTVNINEKNVGKKSLELTADVTAEATVVESRAASGESLTIIQITDIHYDPQYAEGSQADCELYACCRDANSSASTRTAGRWGDYHHCDTPWRAVVDVFEKIKKTFSVR